MKDNRRKYGIMAALCLGVFTIALGFILATPPEQSFDALRYAQGEAYLGQGDLARSGEIFMSMGNYEGSYPHLKTIAQRYMAQGEPQKALEIYRYLQKNQLVCNQEICDTAVALNENGDRRLALNTLYAAPKDLSSGHLQKWLYRKTIATGDDFTVVLGYGIVGKRNGLDLSQWSGVVSISAGLNHLLGLKNDGTVLATGNRADEKTLVRHWTDIIMVSAGYHHSVGLKSDGTVVAQGRNDMDQCKTKDWNNIVMVSAGAEHTVGLHSDGTVVATGSNIMGQCRVKDWRDIVYVSAGAFYTVGIKMDGSVVLATDYPQYFDLSGFYDIVEVAAGSQSILGLRSNGTVVCSDDMCDPAGLGRVVEVYGGGDHMIIRHDDGTLTAMGHNEDGECEIGPWNAVSASTAPVSVG